MSNSLGSWAVIDIETTGVDPSYDSIIDIGFLQFDGTKLVRKYSSLVRNESEVSHFIQKLTGITPSMLKNAPQWSQVEPEVMELYGHHLLAHNADFEHSFLSPFFDDIDDGEQRESYEDSLYFLALLFPERSSLKLENYIIDFGLADQEMHRGYEDSLDLLKVLLIALKIVKSDSERYAIIDNLFDKYGLDDWWYTKLFRQDEYELHSIAKAIQFDLDEAFKTAVTKIEQAASQLDESHYVRDYSLEFSGQNISNILSDEPKLQEKLPFYSFRQSQLDLALKVGQCFKNSVHSLVQAPTGTGKTLGYMLPSSLFALNEKKQVLVATGTKALQEQAMSKDIPQVRNILGLGHDDLKITRMIGSGNHLCELLYRQSMNESDMLSKTLPFSEAFTEIFFELLFYRNSKVPYKDKIVRDDLPFVLKMKFREFATRERNFAVDFRSCTGFKCPYRDDCSYMNGIQEAKESDVIVGNHALMFSWTKAFPRPAHIVVDEAHKIEGEATNAFSMEVTQDALEQLANNLNHNHGLGSLYYLLGNDESETHATDTISKIRDEAQQAFVAICDHMATLPDMIEKYFKKRRNFTDIFWNEGPMVSGKNSNDTLALGIFNHLDSIRHIIAAFSQVINPYYQRWDIKNLKGDNKIIALTRFETFVVQLEDILVALVALLESKEGYSHALKYHGNYGFCTISSPINVGEVLHTGLLSTSSSVVYTSATLGNAHGDQGTKGVEWATGYTYLPPEKRFRSGFFLPAVYDYENKAEVFLCDDTPALFSRDFVPQILGPVMDLIEGIGGKTLLLFSAKSRFEVAREILLDRFDGKIPLFIQGMGNKVVEDFKESGGGILLGMESYGEGIDIPGDALKFVFIDKIPDIRRDLVIEDRRNFYDANIGNEFTDYFLAQRTRSLHQKLGRLLRTTSDSGGAIVVDSRIKGWKGNTMAKLIKLMEPYRLKRAPLKDACREIQEFIINNP